MKNTSEEADFILIKEPQDILLREEKTIVMSDAEFEELLQERLNEFNQAHQEVLNRNNKAESFSPQSILKEQSDDEIEMNCTKTNLNKLIRWSVSKLNQYKKKEVVDLIFDAFEKRIETADVAYYNDYICEAHSVDDDEMKCNHYRVVSYQGEVRLILNPKNSNRTTYLLV